MDFTNNSEIISNLMVFTSVLHNGTPMQSGSHPNGSCLLLKYLRALFAGLLSKYYSWLFVGEVWHKGSSSCQDWDIASVRKRLQKIRYAKQCGIDNAHLKIRRMKETIMSTMEEQPLPKWQVAIRRQLSQPAQQKLPYITWSQFTAAPVSLKTISDGF